MEIFFEEYSSVKVQCNCKKFLDLNIKASIAAQTEGENQKF